MVDDGFPNQPVLCQPYAFTEKKRKIWATSRKNHTHTPSGNREAKQSVIRTILMSDVDIFESNGEISICTLLLIKLTQEHVHSMFQFSTLQVASVKTSMWPIASVAMRRKFLFANFRYEIQAFSTSVQPVRRPEFATELGQIGVDSLTKTKII